MALPKGFIKTKIKKRFPLISVIIPTYNEEKDLGECLKSIKKQTYKNVEVLVVDDGSTDNTVGLALSFPYVRVIKQAHKGPGEARNLGARKAKGDILILIDADMILFPDYIEKLTKPVRENKTIGTIESIQYNIQRTKMQECWGRLIKTTYLNGVNSSTVRAIAKKDFLNLGGFDKKYGYADDRTFFLKYGIRFLILPEVKCYHKTPPTAKGVYKHSVWIGSSLERWPLHYSLVKKIFPFFMIIASPLAIPLLSVYKCYQNKDFKIFFPWMLIFISARYFGTIKGMLRSAYFGLNVK